MKNQVNFCCETYSLLLKALRFIQTYKTFCTKIAQFCLDYAICTDSQIFKSDNFHGFIFYLAEV